MGGLIITVSTALYALMSPLLKKANSDAVPPFIVMAISMFVLFLFVPFWQASFLKMDYI